MTLETTSLHPLFGVEIHNVDLRDAEQDHLYPGVRELFEAHSLLLFRDQALDDRALIHFAELFGPIENRDKGKWGQPRESTSKVSNLGEDGRVKDETSKHVLHLKANQLWHTDSTFLPVPALANVITAITVPSTGGETELATTRAALKEMPEPLRKQAESIVVRHQYGHSRAQIDPDLAKEELFTMWPEQRWRGIWRNPSSGDDALYIASHACAIEGMDDEPARELIRQLIEFATRDRYVYSHRWSPGDVLVWDERATLHRGRPWPYQEPRTLSSVCVSARHCDGLDDVRPAA